MQPESAYLKPCEAAERRTFAHYSFSNDRTPSYPACMYCSTTWITPSAAQQLSNVSACNMRYAFLAYLDLMIFNIRDKAWALRVCVGYGSEQ